MLMSFLMHDRSDNTMKSERIKQSRAAVAMRWTARGLSLLVMGFWLWFFSASLISEYATAGWAGSKIHVFQIAITIALLVLAFFLDLAGGVAFIVCSGLAYYGWGHRQPFVALLMCLPMVVIGIMYIVTWVLGRKKPTQPTPTMHEDHSAI
jgi:hypothetical protein